jgi:hypothetical protein
MITINTSFAGEIPYCFDEQSTDFEDRVYLIGIERQSLTTEVELLITQGFDVENIIESISTRIFVVKAPQQENESRQLMIKRTMLLLEKIDERTNAYIECNGFVGPLPAFSVIKN